MGDWNRRPGNSQQDSFETSARVTDKAGTSGRGTNRLLLRRFTAVLKTSPAADKQRHRPRPGEKKEESVRAGRCCRERFIWKGPASISLSDTCNSGHCKWRAVDRNRGAAAYLRLRPARARSKCRGVRGGVEAPSRGRTFRTCEGKPQRRPAGYLRGTRG